VRDGEDLHAFARDVIELLRRALVLKAAPAAKLADVTHVEANELRALGDAASLDELLYVLRAFLDADAAMRESPHPRIELELATVRATRRPAPKPLEEILKSVDEVAQRLRSGGAAPARQEDSGLFAAEAPAAQRPTAVSRPAPPERPVPAPARPAKPAADPGAAPVPERTGPAPADAGPGWQRVVDEVMRRKPTLGAVLAQTRAGGLREGELTLVLSGNHFHREMLADNANRDIVLQALRRNVAGVDRFRVSAEDEGGGGVTTHPAVQAAVAEFQGEVVAVRPRSTEGEGQ
jgi:hypothetical protein